MDEILPEEFDCIRGQVIAARDTETEPALREWEAEIRNDLTLVVGSDLTSPSCPVRPEAATIPVAQLRLEPVAADLPIPAATDGPRPSPVVHDPAAEPPPLPDFFLERVLNEPAPIFKMDDPTPVQRQPVAESALVPEIERATARPRAGHGAGRAAEAPRSLAEVGDRFAALPRGPIAGQLRPGGGGRAEVLDFGLPTVGDELPLEHLEFERAEEDAGNRRGSIRMRCGWVPWARPASSAARSSRAGRALCCCAGPRSLVFEHGTAWRATAGATTVCAICHRRRRCPGKEALRSGAT